MSRFQYIARAVLIIVSIGVATTVRAAETADMTLEQKVDQADTIVRAECTGVRSEWVGGHIVTRAQFSVANDLTRKGTQQLELTTLGGVAMHPVLKVRVRSTVSEQPEVRLHDQAILFTKRAASGERLLVGGRQGYVRLTQSDNDDASERAVRSERKVIVKPEESPQLATKARGARGTLRLESEPLSVGEFEDRVRTVITARAQRRPGTSR